MKTITFLRHEEITPSGALTNVGKEKAKHRANDLKKLSPFDLVITSSAERTKETAKIITKTLSINPLFESLEELYLPKNGNDRKIVEQLIEELGAVPLCEYIRKDTSKAWQNYAKAAYEAILACIVIHKAENILVVGHGNIINSLGLIINPRESNLKNIYFDYGKGFTIFEKTQNVSYYT